MKDLTNGQIFLRELKCTALGHDWKKTTYKKVHNYDELVERDYSSLPYKMRRCANPYFEYVSVSWKQKCRRCRKTTNDPDRSNIRIQLRLGFRYSILELKDSVEQLITIWNLDNTNNYFEIKIENYDKLPFFKKMKNVIRLGYYISLHSFANVLISFLQYQDWIADTYSGLWNMMMDRLMNVRDKLYMQPEFTDTESTLQEN